MVCNPLHDAVEPFICQLVLIQVLRHDVQIRVRPRDVTHRIVEHLLDLLELAAHCVRVEESGEQTSRVHQFRISQS